MKLPSIKLSGPVLFVLPVLVALAAYGLFASWQGGRLADDLADRVVDQAAGRVEQSINNYLRNAIVVTNFTQQLINAGELNASQLRDWRLTLYRQLQANPDINSVTFGNPAGDATWVIRYPGEAGIEYAISDASTEGEIVEFELGEEGEVKQELGGYAYDPRVRPWYEAAKAKGQGTWSEVYAWVRRGDGASTLGIAYARPIWDDDGALLGVLDSDISLLDVSKFLTDARVFGDSESVLIDKAGDLIATSAGINVVTPAGERVKATDADNALIAAVAQRIEESALAGASREMELDVAGSLFRVDARPLENPWGLEWRLAVAVPDSEITAGVARMRRQGWILGGLIALATLALGLVASRSLVRPVTQLATAVRRIADGDFETPVDVRGHLEFVQLSKELTKMSAGLKDRLQLRQSLELAMEIQQKLLPDNSPKILGLDIAGRSDYCDETGGDYYDFIELEETESNELVVALGDVVGHGIAAALLMATARGILRSRAGDEGSLGQWLTHVNRLLVEDTGGERFMTMVLFVVNPQKRHIRLANAGHDAPIVYDPERDEFLEFPDVGGLPLGLYDDEVYEESHSDCSLGTVLLVGTDGLWESPNAEGQPYGKDRLRDVIRDHAKASADAISVAIDKDLRAFRGKTRQDDDITFVLMKFTDPLSAK